MGDMKVPYWRQRCGWHDTDEAISMGLRGRGLMCAALDFSGMHLTDGVITRAQMLRVIQMAEVSLADADKLVEQGYLTFTNNTYVIPRFAESHRTRAEVEGLRAKRAEAGKLGGRAKAAADKGKAASGTSVEGRRSRDAERQRRHRARRNVTCDVTPTVTRDIHTVSRDTERDGWGDHADSQTASSKPLASATSRSSTLSSVHCLDAGLADGDPIGITRPPANGHRREAAV